MKTVSVVVLAAGAGKRMEKAFAKPLAPLSGVPLIDYPINTATSFLDRLRSDGKVVEGKLAVVLSPQSENVKKHLSDRFSQGRYPVSFAVQKRPLGTADALKSYLMIVLGPKKWMPL